MTDRQAAALMLMFMFYWVPFALVAYLTEHWNEESAQNRRRHLVHPIRYMRAIRPTHGAAAH